MKIINHDKLHEAVMHTGDVLRVDSDITVAPVEDKDVGVSTPVYADAVRQMKVARENTEKNLADMEKAADEFVKENQVRDNKVKVDTLKKLDLNESLFEDYEEIDEADPYDLLYTMLTESGEQYTVTDPETGKKTPRIAKGPYDPDMVSNTIDDNIRITVDSVDALKPAEDIAAKYDVTIVRKSTKLPKPYIELDPWTINMGKALADNKVPLLKDIDEVEAKLGESLAEGKGRYVGSVEDADGEEITVMVDDNLEKVKKAVRDVVAVVTSGKGHIWDKEEQKVEPLDTQAEALEAKPLKEAKIIREINFNTYESTENVQRTLDRIKEEGKVEALEALIEEMYPEGVEETVLDDILGYESDWLFDMLGIRDED